MPETVTRGVLLRDVPARTAEGRGVCVSDFRSKRNIVLVIPEADTPPPKLVQQLARDASLRAEEAVVLIAADRSAREAYEAPKSALFIADRYGEVFFSARAPDPLPDAAEILSWLEFINRQCPE